MPIFLHRQIAGGDLFAFAVFVFGPKRKGLLRGGRQELATFCFCWPLFLTVQLPGLLPPSRGRFGVAQHLTAQEPSLCFPQYVVPGLCCWTLFGSGSGETPAAPDVASRLLGGS